jgi:hypothetical protein
MPRLRTRGVRFAHFAFEEDLVKNSALDTITRHAAGVVSRRGSVRLLSGAALAGALAAPELAGAGKAGKKAKKQAAKRCKQQGGPCRAFIAEGCALTEDPRACEEAFFPCCAHLERCDAGAGLTCIAGPVGQL